MGSSLTQAIPSTVPLSPPLPLISPATQPQTHYPLQKIVASKRWQPNRKIQDPSCLQALISRLNKANQQKEEVSKAGNKVRGTPQLPLLGVSQKHQANNYSTYTEDTEDLEQTYVGPVLASSVSVSPYEPCLVVLVGHVLLVEFPNLWGKGPDGDLQFRFSLLPFATWGSLSNND